MSNLLAEGTWPCTVLSAGAGEEIDQSGAATGIIKARVNVRIDDGPSKGRTCTYEDAIDSRSSIYVRRSLMACGWKGSSLATVADDTSAWVATTGGKTTVEIRHIEIKKGKRAGQIWDKPSAIGRGPKPLASPSKGALSDADDAMRRAAADDTGAPPADVNAPANDDIPFISCSLSDDLGAVAAVLK
jgi:hypothetical protein